MSTDCEDGFPASDGVGADHGVDGGEVFAAVEGRAARCGVEIEAFLFGSFEEMGLFVGSGKGLEEFLPRSGKAVVHLAAGSPEGV